MELIGCIKNYEWGKLGKFSEVAQLAIANDDKSTTTIDESMPYAELWMGDHPSGAARIKSTDELLNDNLTNHLPFLFKVLSIRKALSIQVHPNKEEAERLHKNHPDIYKDANHKPELAIALTAFTALCGFRPYREIYNFLMQLPPLKELINIDDEQLLKLKNGSIESLKRVYKMLMTSNENAVEQTIQDIQSRYVTVLQSHNLHDIFLKIYVDFPNDVGVLSIFFLNVIYLQPGESIYLGANEIHAYLQGDCVECMACSDNVVRAGLTCKYKDVNQLLHCLNYEGQPAESKYFKPKPWDHYSQIFAPPVKDFAVIQISIPKDASNEYIVQLPQKASILLIIKGHRLLQLSHQDKVFLKRGSIVYLLPEYMKHLCFLNNNLDSTDDFLAYLATENSFAQ